MKAAFILALIVSIGLVPLQPALAGPTIPSADVELLVSLAQLDSHHVVLAEAENIVVHLISGDKTIVSGIVNVDGTSTVCTTVDVTGCPTPTQVVLSDCSPVANTYTFVPGGPGVGTFSDGPITGTVFNGSILLTCQTLPPPTATRH
jgi:hypothetical protein